MPSCQLCDGSLTRVIDLGFHPLADHFLYEKEMNSKELHYPLRVAQCGTCGHLMLDHCVPPEERYQAHDYSYTASNSIASVRHFEELASAALAGASVGKGDLVVDIGSNDGTLLIKCREKSGCEILGVEPSHNIAQIARGNGVETVEELFSEKLGKRFVSEKGEAKLILATNTFNHIGDLKDFVRGIAALLRDDGRFIFEVPYALDLIKRTAFDTIYLEHTSYFNVKPFAQFFESHGLSIVHAERTEYMGGSIRVTVSKERQKNQARGGLEALINEEVGFGVYSSQTYVDFMTRVKDFKVSLMHELYSIRSEGAGSIVGVGAAAKGNTLLNFCGIDTTLLACVTDSSPLKVGKYTPGTHIPIKSDEALSGREVTHALILPWNIADLLQEKLRRPGLSFIIPRINV